MEFRIGKGDLVRGLRLAQSVADRKSTMPMLANVLLRVAASDRLLCAATDLNVSVLATLPLGLGTGGGIAVNAKAIHDIVVNMPGDTIAIRRVENNWAEIKSGKATYRIVGVPDRDFPKMPDPKDAPFSEVDASTLREMIDRTLFSVCNDETRFHLNGVLLESSGATARMVSTDGHRLSRVDRTMNGPKLSHGVIISKKGLLEIKRLLDGVKICQLAIRMPHIYIAVDGITVISKLIDAMFPPYDQVIPKDHKRSAIVNRALLADAVRRASLMSSDTRGIKLSLSDDGIRITSDNPDVGEVTEDLEARCEGGPITVGFNPRYMVDILGQIVSTDVVIQLGDELAPGVIRPCQDDDYLGVIMPMRV